MKIRHHDTIAQSSLDRAVLRLSGAGQESDRGACVSGKRLVGPLVFILQDAAQAFGLLSEDYEGWIGVAMQQTQKGT